MPRSLHHSMKYRLVNSGPLSHRMRPGAPRSSITRSSTRVTCRLEIPVLTSIARRLFRVTVDQRERPQRAPGRQSIGNKVHGPLLVGPHQQRVHAVRFASAVCASAAAPSGPSALYSR